MSTNENQKNVSMKKKRLRYGVSSSLSAVIVIAVMILVNLLVSEFDIKWDLTKEKFYTVSEDTKEIIGNLQDDVTIYAIAPNQDNKIYSAMLDEYQTYSNKIKVVYKDPYTNAAFLNKYTSEDKTLGLYSIIVESSKRFKIIESNDLQTTEFDYQTGQQNVTSLNIEPRVTNAIQFVLSDNTTKAYQLTGHNEGMLDDSYIKKLNDAGVEYATLELIKNPEIPEDCNVIIMTTPQRDYSPTETEAIVNYLEKGGRAFLAIDPVTIPTPNLDSIVNMFGLSYNKSVVFEANADNYIQGSPIYILPYYSDHGITKPIVEKKYPMILALNQGIDVLEMKPKSVKLEPLLATSNIAYAKNNPESQSQNKEEGDLEGPFNLAMAVTNSFYVGDKQDTTKLIVLGSTSIFIPQIDEASVRSNSEFFINSVKWLTGTSDSSDYTYIRGKSTQDQTSVVMTIGQQVFVLFLSLIIIPSVIIITGIVIWLRRRNK